MHANKKIVVVIADSQEPNFFPSMRTCKRIHKNKIRTQNNFIDDK